MAGHLFVCGDSGGGKTHYLRTVWVPGVQVPLLVIDLTGEWEDGADAVVPTTRAAVRALLAGHRRVVLAAYDLPTEAAALAEILCPAVPTAPALGRALGGVAVLCDEFDLLMPNGRTPPAWTHAYRRARHYQVTFLAATQRASSVDRLVTALAGHVASAAQHEPRDRDYLRASLPPAWVDGLDALPYQGLLTYQRADRSGEMLAPDGAGDYQVIGTWVDPPGAWQ